MIEKHVTSPTQCTEMSTLFIHILDILLEILEDDKFENILQNITKNSKWTNIENIDKFPSNYPKEILKLIKTGIKLTDNIPDNLDDYTWLIMEPLKALEGHLKWKLDNNKIKLSEKNGFEWLGECDVKAEELLCGTAKGMKQKTAVHFLEDTLSKGKMAQTKIAELAEEKGISNKTLRNAKKSLDIKASKIGNQWYWEL